jgi:pyruvate formate lyase activating enzyme
MIIAEIQKFSLIDFPGKTCATIFTQGCNFRCRYCHNPETWHPSREQKSIPLDSVYNFLKSRVGKLDAVTITGGEPTIHSDLIEVIKKIKKMGLLVKLDTNGSNTDTLITIIKERLVDYIAMDVKAPLDKDKYAKIIGWPISPNILMESIKIIIDSRINHEFRTTIAKSLTTKEDLCEIAKTIKGAENYYLQKFVPSQKINDKKLLNDTSYPYDDLQRLADEFLKFVKNCKVR